MSATAPIDLHPEGALRGWGRPIRHAVIILLALAGTAWGVSVAIDSYRDRVVLQGLNGHPTPLDVIVGGEPMTIPANMIRFRNERRRGPLDQVDLALTWPELAGYSDEVEDVFKDTSPDAPRLYVTFRGRDSQIDSSARLDALYANFFQGPVVVGPAGLVGRALSEDSGYGGEIVFFEPRARLPFVTRCLAEATPEIPATCIRDVNVGKGLSMFYRFNRTHLAEWQAIDTSLLALAAEFLKRP